MFLLYTNSSFLTVSIVSNNWALSSSEILSSLDIFSKVEINLWAVPVWKALFILVKINLLFSFSNSLFKLFILVWIADFSLEPNLAAFFCFSNSVKVFWYSLVFLLNSSVFIASRLVAKYLDNSSWPVYLDNSL